MVVEAVAVFGLTIRVNAAAGMMASVFLAARSMAPVATEGETGRFQGLDQGVAQDCAGVLCASIVNNHER